MRRIHRALYLAALGLAIAPSAWAQSKSPDDWAWRLGVNLWLPGIDTTTSHSLPVGGGITAETDPGNYLEKLKFTIMGTLEGQSGPWSILADMVYLDFGDLKSKVTSISGPGGAINIPIDVGSKSDLKGFVGTLAGGYAISQSPDSRMEVVAGLRYLKLKPRLDWELSGPTGGLLADGTIEASKDFTDGVVGVRGKTALGGKYDLRYYIDAGAGGSKLTWQAAAGIGYRLDWGDLVLGYRHLAYELKDDRPISKAQFSGPQFVVGFTF